MLAGGKGVRIGSELPKVLLQLQNKPLILHVLEGLNRAGIIYTIVVVGYRGEMVIEAIGKRARAVWQNEQLGTGHAVMQAEEELRNFNGRVIVACGDVPLIRPETFIAMVEASMEPDVKAVVLTMIKQYPTGYGRVIRGSRGDFQKIVEERDASSDEKKITEVNTGTYVFDREFLFRGLEEINTDNAQNEYYLPDALQYVIKTGHRVKVITLDDPIEGSGVNTKDELHNLEKYLREKNRTV